MIIFTNETAELSDVINEWSSIERYGCNFCDEENMLDPSLLVSGIDRETLSRLKGAPQLKTVELRHLYSSSSHMEKPYCCDPNQMGTEQAKRIPHTDLPFRF